MYRSGTGVRRHAGKVATAEACKQLCSSTADDTACRAISYDTKSSGCILHTEIGASNTYTKGGWEFYKKHSCPTPSPTGAPAASTDPGAARTCVRVSAGRGKWSSRIVAVVHSKNLDMALAQCIERCTVDPKCTQAAYAFLLAPCRAMGKNRLCVLDRHYAGAA